LNRKTGRQEEKINDLLAFPSSCEFFRTNRYTTASTVQLSQGITVAGRYQLVHEIGRGGMGSVWRAHHVGLNIPCAIKFILGEAAAIPSVRGRFEQEAQAAAQLKSPNVVQIFDHGVWEGMPYIAMELLLGEDLANRLARRGRLQLQEVAVIVAQVARALGKAHAVGLVHRDLKPANIFLVHDDDGEIAKILDFGVAKQTQQDISQRKTKTGSLLGTPYYMSPEQARGISAVDFRSDLWSLGVIVYECVTGQLPFQSDAFGDLLVQIMFSPLPMPSQLAHLPPGFDAFWARAVAREPAERFQSARELADALAQLAGLPSGQAAALTKMEPSGSVPPGPKLAGSDHQGLAALTTASISAVALPMNGSRRWIPIAAVAVFVLTAGVVLFILRGTGATVPLSVPPVITGAQVAATPSPPAKVPDPASSQPVVTVALDPSTAPQAPPAPPPSVSAPAAPRTPAKPPASRAKPGATAANPVYDDGI
jgi:serine/threonine protein kinase